MCPLSLFLSRLKKPQLAQLLLIRCLLNLSQPFLPFTGHAPAPQFPFEREGPKTEHSGFVWDYRCKCMYKYKVCLLQIFHLSNWGTRTSLKSDNQTSTNRKKKYFLKICINIHGTIFRCYPFSQFFFHLLRNHSYPSHLCHFSFHLSRAECSNKLSLFFLSWKRWDSLVSNTSGCGTEKRRDLGEPPGWHSDAKIWFSIR